MATIIRRMFSLRKPKRPKNYTAQRESLQSAKARDRLSLAKDSQTNKEILYYLAEQDPDPKVRAAVAKNRSMPVHASPILAADRDTDVRLALAGRLVDLLPDLSEDKQSQLYAFAVQALGTLALDEVLKIRVALSSTLKDHAFTPPKIAGQLARDVEREVSEPILRFCAALSDEDLLDILKSHPASWVVQAIANRDHVSPLVSEAVIDVEDVPGGAALIGNDGANLTQSLLHIIVEKARSFPEWQKPMAVRKSLPVSIARELASFVDASVRDLLMARGDFDAEESEEIAAVFRRRLDFAAQEDENSGESVEGRLQRAIKDGSLSEDMIFDALGMRDYDFAVAALSHFLKCDSRDARKIMDMQAPKSIVALVWRAGFSMRLAFQFQKTIGQVQPKDLIYPKGGTDYPLTDAELEWQLDFLGLKSLA
ncbi:MAG: DUF2336 domain-containing protein [Bdellovibrionales bacterium]